MRGLPRETEILTWQQAHGGCSSYLRPAVRPRVSFVGSAPSYPSPQKQFGRQRYVSKRWRSKARLSAAVRNRHHLPPLRRKSSTRLRSRHVKLPSCVQLELLEHAFKLSNVL